jgi:hypothetical protein
VNTGRALRVHRTSAKLTLSSIAWEAQVSVAYLSNIELGCKPATAPIIQVFCAAVGTTSTRYDELVQMAKDDRRVFKTLGLLRTLTGDRNLRVTFRDHRTTSPWEVRRSDGSILGIGYSPERAVIYALEMVLLDV